jgi:hypothetical protein
VERDKRMNMPMYVNAKMIPVETVQESGKGG